MSNEHPSKDQRLAGLSSALPAASDLPARLQLNTLEKILAVITPDALEKDTLNAYNSVDQKHLSPKITYQVPLIALRGDSPAWLQLKSTLENDPLVKNVSYQNYKPNTPRAETTITITFHPEEPHFKKFKSFLQGLTDQAQKALPAPKATDKRNRANLLKDFKGAAQQITTSVQDCELNINTDHLNNLMKRLETALDQDEHYVALHPLQQVLRGQFAEVAQAFKTFAFTHTITPLTTEQKGTLETSFKMALNITEEALERATNNTTQEAQIALSLAALRASPP